MYAVAVVPPMNQMLQQQMLSQLSMSPISPMLSGNLPGSLPGNLPVAQAVAPMYAPSPAIPQALPLGQSPQALPLGYSAPPIFMVGSAGAKPLETATPVPAPAPAAPAVKGTPEGTVSVKDPRMKGSIQHEVPVSRIQPTAGLTEHFSTAPGARRHACICRLWMEGRCGQGERCKSFHVDRELVLEERRKRPGDLADIFISEVALKMASGTVFAIGYNALARTRGLEAFREERKACKDESQPIKPVPLCKHYEADGKGECPNGRQCACLHLRPGGSDALADCRLRTPCCGHHGDDTIFQKCEASTLSVTTIHGSTLEVPISRFAYTTGMQQRQGQKSIHANDICVPHGTSRCKYGRRCAKLHLCRDWVSKLNEAPTDLEVSLPQDTCIPCPDIAQTPHSASLTRKVSLRTSSTNALSYAPTGTSGSNSPSSDLSSPDGLHLTTMKIPEVHLEESFPQSDLTPVSECPPQLIDSDEE